MHKIFKIAKKKRAIGLCIRAMEKFKNAKKKRAVALSLFLFGGGSILGVLPAGAVCREGVCHVLRYVVLF